MARLYSFKSFHCVLIIWFSHWTLSEDVPEFQYPCYVDVCTFPRQFCNSDRSERRCSPCSPQICQEDRVPTACKYICAKNDKPKQIPSSTTEAVPVSLGKSEQQSACVRDDSLYLIMAYSAVACTILVILMIVFVGYYVHHKRLKYDRSRDRTGLDLSFMDKQRHRSGIGTVSGQEQYFEDPQVHGACEMNEIEECYTTSPPSYRTQENVASTSIERNSQTSSNQSSRKLRNENPVLNNQTRQSYQGHSVTTATQVEPEAGTSNQHVSYVSGQPSTTRTVCNASNDTGYSDKAWTMGVNTTEQTALMTSNNAGITVTVGDDGETSCDEDETNVKS